MIILYNLHNLVSRFLSRNDIQIVSTCKKKVNIFPLNVKLISNLSNTLRMKISGDVLTAVNLIFYQEVFLTARGLPSMELLLTLILSSKTIYNFPVAKDLLLEKVFTSLSSLKPPKYMESTCCYSV